MNEIIVKKVDLEEVDRLNNTIELQRNTIKYQQDQYLKLQRKLDCKETYGVNNLLLSYSEIIDILKSEYHPLKNYIERWFGDNLEYLYFSEDGIEVEEDDYWLVNVKTDYACAFKDLDKLNRKLYELEKMGEEDEFI